MNCLRLGVLTVRSIRIAGSIPQFVRAAAFDHIAADRYFAPSRLSRMLKKSASPSCSFGLFGLSGLFGCIRLTRWIRQTGLVLVALAIEVLPCQYGFPSAC